MNFTSEFYNSINLIFRLHFIKFLIEGYVILSLELYKSVEKIGMESGVF